MKKNLLFFPAVIAALLLSSCSRTSTEKESDKESSDHTPAATTSMDTVRLETALMNIKHYQDSCSKYFKDSIPIKAYTIHSDDMLMALGLDPDSIECPYPHARVYLGLDENNKFKLYFTPVIGADLNADVMFAGRDTILKDANKNLFVMDLNAPCPNTCDDASPLCNPK